MHGNMLYAWISHSYSHVFKYLHLLCVFIWIFGLVWFGFFFKIADFPLIKSRLLKIVFVVCFNGTLCFSDCFKMFMDFYIQSSIFMQGEILRIFFLDFDMQTIVLFWEMNFSSPDTKTTTLDNTLQQSCLNPVYLCHVCSELIQDPLALLF